MSDHGPKLTDEQLAQARRERDRVLDDFSQEEA